MSGRRANALSGMDYDEVSLVNRPAVPPAAVVLAKAYQGDDMADSPTGYFWEDGTPVTEDDEIGPEDTIFDADDNAFGLSPEAIAQLQADAEEAANEREPEMVGKSAFGRTGPAPQRGGQLQKSLAQELSDQLKAMVSKGEGDDPKLRSIVTKAVEALTVSEQRQDQLEKAFQAEQEIRLTGEYIAKAASYGDLPGVSPQELGPVLMRAEALLPTEDCRILHKAFEATGGLLFNELGKPGTGSNVLDPMAVIESMTEGDDAAVVTKSADGQTLSKADQATTFMAAHPEAYDEYMAARYETTR